MYEGLGPDCDDTLLVIHRCPFREKRTALLGALLLVACGRPPSTTVGARPWSTAPDVVALTSLYRNGETSCSEAAPSFPSAPKTQVWTCTVAGWSEITLVREVGASERTLTAHNDSPLQCAFDRFSDDVEIVNTMQAAILTETLAVLKSGPLTGACMIRTTFYAGRAGCTVAFFAPSARAGYGSQCREAF